MKVVLGLQKLCTDARHLVRGSKVALLAHPASVDHRLEHAQGLVEGAGATITALWGPEHGFGGEAQDMEAVAAGPRAKAGPPLYSLYGSTEETLRPERSMLEGAEAVVVDLQDVGSRYYTFVWTAALCLELCHQEGIRLIALDRPNPLACHHVEGPGIDSGYTSFVGLHDVSVRHGMTLGEILRLYARDKGIEDALEVVTMEGYNRQMWLDDTALPWVLPSPNMPTCETALVYPGMCLLEGTNLSEGRGTTRPFELVGAPWLEGRQLASELSALGLPGCAFRPTSFRPTFQKHQGKTCSGVQIHVTDRERFLPWLTGVALLWTVFRAAPETGWRQEAYEFVLDLPAIDLLAGGPWLRQGIEGNAELQDLKEGWAEAEEAFRERRQSVLLYESTPPALS